MKCYACGAECEGGRCPVCTPSLKLVTPPGKKQVHDPPMQVLPKSIGICPDCGTEQAGNVYRISSAMAEFLQIKNPDAFVAEKHRCSKKIAG